MSKLPNEIYADECDYYKGWNHNPCGGELYINANSPDYYIVKKSEVDGDAMGAYDRIKIRFDGILDKEFDLIRNALLAQSCSETRDTSDSAPRATTDTTVVDGFIGFYDPASVNIHFVGYNSNERLMRVEFTDGGKFNYQDVSDEIFKGFAAAEHRGKFLHENVKGHYRYYQVNGD